MCAGMLSHQLKQHVIDGEKTIIQNPTDQQKWVHSASASCHRPDSVFNQWMILSLFVFVERTMRRLSLRCMRYMPWMCSSALERARWEEIWYTFSFFCVILERQGIYNICLVSGEGWRSEDHRLQTRPQQGVRLKDEDISDILQWDGETLRYNAFHSEVASFKL